ncbi:MAG: hypothetical protein GY799_17820 [Desulfobulbaceae bacterium]|nr:hypothetical protein [Desulfobulbaceae bacterium]
MKDKITLALIASLAVERGCQRLERGCLDWNESPIKFYKELGAIGVDNMRIYRFAPDKLTEIVNKFQSRHCFKTAQYRHLAIMQCGGFYIFGGSA